MHHKQHRARSTIGENLPIPKPSLAKSPMVMAESPYKKRRKGVKGEQTEVQK
jgi:hypothetical protein